MEAQAQEAMEREVACDVVYRAGDSGPHERVSEHYYADVGDESIRTVRAELVARDQTEDYDRRSHNQMSSMLTTEAIRRDGRTLVFCGTRSLDYDSDGALELESYRIFRTINVVTSREL